MKTMDSLLLIFILACSSALLWLELPLLPLLLPFVVLVFYFGCKLKSNHLYKVTSALTGIAWMASVGYWDTYWQPSPQYYQQTVMVSGEVKTLLHGESGVRFNLAADRVAEESFHLSPVLIRLSWFKPDWKLEQGQRVTLQVKLKQPRGLANEFGFNYQQWLFAHQIKATGYVKSSVINVLKSTDKTQRQKLLDKIQTYQLKNEAWILALAIGYRGVLKPSDWELLQNTGTAHLIAISGLHIGMIAAATYFLVSLMIVLPVALFQKHNSFNVHYIALGMAVLSSLGYAWIAGFSLPTLRAFAMLALLWGLSILKWHWSFKRVFLVSMTMMILLFPLSLFSISFWFSFAAVAFIGLVFWRWPVNRTEYSLKNNLKVAIRIQLGLSLLMLPIVASQMGIMSLSAPVVNLVAVPVMSFLLLPLTLIATSLAAMGIDVSRVAFKWLDGIFDWFLLMLETANEVPISAIHIPGLSLWAWFGVFGIFVFWLLPRLPFNKTFLCVLCIPWFSELLAKPLGWQVDILDVGQGLSVLVSQERQVVLYDTGPAFPSGFNMGDAVIVPLLKGRGNNRIDKVIISHSDLDHRGGYPYLLKRIPVLETLSEESGCFAGKHWTTGILTWHVLWPLPEEAHQFSDNDSSCVVKVSDGKHSLLMTGDIETLAERQILNYYREDLSILQADVLVAPHHGSKTSSSEAFIEAVSPEVVVFSQGFNNRWGLPHDEVVRRYQAFGSRMLRTSDSGQISISFEPKMKIREYRKDIYPYWYANK